MSYTLKCDDGDLVQNAAGQYTSVAGLEKVSQDVAESLLNNYDPDNTTYYNGSELYKVGDQTTILSTIGVEEWVHSIVMESMDRLQDLQDDDNYVDEAESIESIQELTVNKIGYFSWKFMLRILTESEDNIPMDFTISLSQQLPDYLKEEFGKFVTLYSTSYQAFL